MKKILPGILMMISVSAFAQDVVKQAIINTTTNITAPEEESIEDVGNQGRGGGFRNFGDGETKSVTYVKDGMVKTAIKTDMMRSTTIRDNDKKLTTTLMEMMGKKMGFYMTDEDQKEMGKKMDSMMRERNKDSVQKKPQTDNKINVEYNPKETKKIAGYVCQKAYIISTNFLGQKDTVAVWFTPEFKITNTPSTGGTSGFGRVGNKGFDQVNGFIMAYTTKMGRGRTMDVEVTKVDLIKDIENKEFDIPKDFDLKPMSEMQNMFGGGRGGQGGGRVMIGG